MTEGEMMLPCPFCGGKPRVGERQDEDLWSHNIVWWTRIYCIDCDVGFEWPETVLESALDRWNKRAATPAAARIAELERALREAAAEIERLHTDAKTSKELADDYKADSFRLHAEKMTLFDALLEMRCRDDRNGSLPIAYREIIDAALASRPTPTAGEG